MCVCVSTGLGGVPPAWPAGPSHYCLGGGVIKVCEGCGAGLMHGGCEVEKVTTACLLLRSGEVGGGGGGICIFTYEKGSCLIVPCIAYAQDMRYTILFNYTYFSCYCHW